MYRLPAYKFVLKQFTVFVRLVKGIQIESSLIIPSIYHPLIYL